MSDVPNFGCDLHKDYTVFRSQDARMGPGPSRPGCSQERGIGQVSDDFASRGFGDVVSVCFLDVDGGPVGGRRDLTGRALIGD